MLSLRYLCTFLYVQLSFLCLLVVDFSSVVVRLLCVATSFAIAPTFLGFPNCMTSGFSFTVSRRSLESEVTYGVSNSACLLVYRAISHVLSFSLNARVFWVLFMSILNNLLLQVSKVCAYCRKGVKEGDIFVDPCMSLLQAACSKISGKIFAAQVEKLQDQRHARFGVKAKIEEQNAAKRKAGCFNHPPRFRLGIRLRSSKLCSFGHRILCIEHVLPLVSSSVVHLKLFLERSV